MRWLEGQVDRERNGELYRFVADRRGAFVQPALFEAFGLTVIEAMSTGLPTFATCFGGPLEIIEDGVSGFHIDPNHGDAATERMADFFARCAEDPGEWDRISAGALDRVAARYTWARYAERLMTLSKVYGFWRHVTEPGAGRDPALPADVLRAAVPAAGGGGAAGLMANWRYPTPGVHRAW